MRYAIGCQVKRKGMIGPGFSGIYVQDEYALPFIKTSLTEETVLIPIFDSDKDAELFAQILARSYRRDDVWLNDKLKSRSIRKFYPLKIDSSNFPFKVEIQEGDGKCRDLKLKYDRFKNRDENGLEYKRYTVKLIPK